MTQTTERPWLSAEQQAVWRGWLRMTALLPAALQRQLQDDSQLSLPDLDVLVPLSEGEGRIRVSDLARALQWERSRLSHHVRRMEARGLVAREDCPDDARGSFVVLTEHGRRSIEQAAPGHARAVRELFLDRLTDDELRSLGAITSKVVAALEDADAD